MKDPPSSTERSETPGDLFFFVGTDAPTSLLGLPTEQPGEGGPKWCGAAQFARTASCGVTGTVLREVTPTRLGVEDVADDRRWSIARRVMVDGAMGGVAGPRSTVEIAEPPCHVRVPIPSGRDHSRANVHRYDRKIAWPLGETTYHRPPRLLRPWPVAWPGAESFTHRYNGHWL